MGFMKRWDMTDVLHQVHRCYSQAVNNHNDGYVQWDCKKELLDLKYELDHMLSQTASFGSIEEDYHTEQEKKKIVRILKA